MVRNIMRKITVLELLSKLNEESLLSECEVYDAEEQGITVGNQYHFINFWIKEGEIKE